MHLNTIRFAHRYRYLYDAFQGLLTKGFSLPQESQFLMDRINFAARDKIDSSLSNRLTSIFNLKRIKEEMSIISPLVFRGLFSSSRCDVRHWCIAVIVGVFVVERPR